MTVAACNSCCESWGAHVTAYYFHVFVRSQSVTNTHTHTFLHVVSPALNEQRSHMRSEDRFLLKRATHKDSFSSNKFVPNFALKTKFFDGLDESVKRLHQRSANQNGATCRSNTVEQDVLLDAEYIASTQEEIKVQTKQATR